MHHLAVVQAMFVTVLPIILLTLGRHTADASEENFSLRRKNHPTGLEELEVDNRLEINQRQFGGGSGGGSRGRCNNANLPRSHNLVNMITMRRGQQRGRLRHYRIMTPPTYNPKVASKVLLYFHGWGEDSSTFGQYSRWVTAARNEGYVVVVPEGIQNSWQFPGSSDGVGNDGSSITTCDTRMGQPRYCYADTCPCRTRCGWTQCQDDDLKFALELIQHMQTKICVDTDRIYAMGVSNGGMLTWSMAQDRRIAPLLAGIAPMIGVPHNDYRQGKATSRDLPVIGFYGNSDDVVPPGNFRDAITEDDAGYYWISAHKMHTTWARDHDCHIPNNGNGSPPYTYYQSNNLQGYAVRCLTYCRNSVPYSVDCRIVMGHDTPDFMMSMALTFFENHHYRKTGNAGDRRNGGN